MATVFYRPQALETIARRTLSEYDPMYLNGSPRAVPIETIIEKTFGLRIEYQYLTNDARELGRMIYDSGITTYYNREIMDYALMRVEGGTIKLNIVIYIERLFAPHREWIGALFLCPKPWANTRDWRCFI